VSDPHGAPVALRRGSEMKNAGWKPAFVWGKGNNRGLSPISPNYRSRTSALARRRTRRNPRRSGGSCCRGQTD